MGHDRRLKTPHYLRGIYVLAAAMPEEHLRLAPQPSFSADLVHDLWRTTNDRERIIRALFKARMLDYADAPNQEIAYGWTPLGRSLAVATRQPRADGKSIMLYDWLQVMPMDMLIAFCNCPSETVPEWAPLTNELRLTLTRTQTGKFSLRDLDAPTLIDFFEQSPLRTPPPSQLNYAELTRAADIAARDRLHAALTRIRNYTFGVAPDRVDPADFDWDADYNEMILSMDF